MKNVDNQIQEPIYNSALSAGGPYIHVDYVASRIAFLYEKVRQVIDYQEEHLLRENAIERILRRRLFHMEQKEPFALSLIQELIRAGYFPNDSIPESRIDGVQTILDKYITILKDLRKTKRHTKDILDFLYGIAACEIEEFIDPQINELTLLEFEYETLRSKLQILGSEISHDKKDALLFTAVNQTLLRADNRRIYFRLMQKIYPWWFEDHGSPVAEFSSPPEAGPPSAEKIEEMKASLDEIIEHAALKHLRSVTRQFDVVFHIISDVTNNDPSKLMTLMADNALLTQEVKRAYEKRFNVLKTKLRRAGFGSVVSIFLSKVLIAISFEIPFELLIMKQPLEYSFFVTILLLPLLMFFIVATIRLPKKKNLETLVNQIGSIISETFDFQPIKLHARKRKLVTSLLLLGVQILILGIIFSIVIFILTLFHLSFLGIVVFIAFLSLIIFSGMRIKQWSYELTVGTRKEGVGGFLIDVLSIPIVIFGKALAGKFYKFNIFILLTNLVFEAPFQSFINFIEEWRKFVGEKKEEL